MTAVLSSLETGLKRWTIFLGVLQITVGCALGFIPPPAVAWYRGIVMAHIEFTANGILMIVFAFLIGWMRLGAGALRVWFAALQIGAWTNGTAGVVAALSGQSSKLLPTANEKFPPPGGMDGVLPTALLLTCGAAMMTALFITLYGLARGWRSDKSGL